jgi:hypothetical protein
MKLVDERTARVVRGVLIAAAVIVGVWLTLGLFGYALIAGQN